MSIIIRVVRNKENKEAYGIDIFSTLESHSFFNVGKISIRGSDTQFPLRSFSDQARIDIKVKVGYDSTRLINAGALLNLRIWSSIDQSLAFLLAECKFPLELEQLRKLGFEYSIM